MCGRYTITVGGAGAGADPKLRAIMEALERHFPGACKTGEIRPGDTAPAIIGVKGRVVPVPAAFGWPGFADGRPLINARAETAAAKPTFADALERRRIILPACGFFEWGRDERRTKYLFTPEADSREVMYLCGLFREIDGLRRFVILTRAANETVADIHDRMPVILGEGGVRAYLNDAAAARELIASASPRLTASSFSSGVIPHSDR